MVIKDILKNRCPTGIPGFDVLCQGGFYKNSINAILGGPGAGKTTLVDLITGLIKPSSGEIQIDGATLRSEQINSWRNLIAYVPQNDCLFNDTIKNNIAKILCNTIQSCTENTVNKSNNTAGILHLGRSNKK